mmetsp:Transcript_58110/g.177060  ORF Transcript_58110/g.177060 Transcript_58110/m.177060 type:complete len:277 (-) Transcript_58110:44-874(-)
MRDLRISPPRRPGPVPAAEAQARRLWFRARRRPDRRGALWPGPPAVDPAAQRCDRWHCDDQQHERCDRWQCDDRQHEPKQPGNAGRPSSASRRRARRDQTGPARRAAPRGPSGDPEGVPAGVGVQSGRVRQHGRRDRGGHLLAEGLPDVHLRGRPQRGFVALGFWRRGGGPQAVLRGKQGQAEARSDHRVPPPGPRRWRQQQPHAPQGHAPGARGGGGCLQRRRPARGRRARRAERDQRADRREEEGRCGARYIQGRLGGFGGRGRLRFGLGHGGA